MSLKADPIHVGRLTVVSRTSAGDFATVVWVDTQSKPFCIPLSELMLAPELFRSAAL